MSSAERAGNEAPSESARNHLRERANTHSEEGGWRGGHAAAHLLESNAMSPLVCPYESSLVPLGISSSYMMYAVDLLAE